ncbi:AMP-binding protein [Streptomyces sp. NPDC029216]|uniref:AMP-binding protein n=1 Tax=Streptomyces sp. NPDC029216 TaxID=3154701 RepID=UPI0033C6AAFA
MTQAPQSADPGRPAAGTVLDRFEQRVRDTPGAPAALVREDLLSYAALDARANRLAHHLLALGLPAHTRIAIGLTRREEALVALLAVLKAGAAYALIDIEDTRTARFQLIALDPGLLITHAAGEARLDRGGRLRTLLPDEEADRISARPDHPPARSPQGSAQAAVLFTGTALPRPVPVGHALLLAAHESWAEVARPAPEDRHLFTGGADLTPFAAGWTAALCTGGALVLSGGAAFTPGEIPDTVSARDVTVLHTDPANALRLLGPGPGPAGAAGRGRREPSPALSTLRLLAVTGDRLHLDEQTALQDRLRTGARVLNVYAPTEAAGAGTWFELPQLRRPPAEPERLSLLGTPFPGCRVDLRDGELHLTPPGGGDALATGDLAELRPDGLLEFRGRLRDRITLPDGGHLDPYPVESVIRTHPDLGAAIVAPVTDGTDTRLVAYVTPTPEDPDWTRSGPPVGIEALRKHLAGKVPPAGTPARLVRLRALPRTRAGQEDRAAVPQPPQPAKEPRRAGGGKYGAGGGGEPPGCFAFGCAAVPLTVVALFVTDLLWPGSTDLTGVPGPWAFLFSVLYAVECAAFAAGLLFLLAGRKRMVRPGRGRGLATAAHLAVAYLLMAWWPQDNLYRLAAKHDWPRQAALVYTFNIPLMAAGLVVALYLTRKPVSPFDFDG